MLGICVNYNSTNHRALHRLISRYMLGIHVNYNSTNHCALYQLISKYMLGIHFNNNSANQDIISNSSYLIMYVLSGIIV